MSRDTQRCKWCGASIFMARSNQTGRWVPFDAAKLRAADIVQAPGCEPVARRHDVYTTHICPSTPDED